jgi:hypothetical protein
LRPAIDVIAATPRRRDAATPRSKPPAMLLRINSCSVTHGSSQEVVFSR